MDTLLGTLFIVATPIGNMGDYTLRAKEVLCRVEYVLCEDTRVSRPFLNALGSAAQVMSYHQHSGGKVINDIIDCLKAGKDIALITDAGTPGISDPGNELITQLTDRLPGIMITPVPGVSAVAAALSISGFPTDSFLFLGFPPHKNKRKKFFETVAHSEYTTVFYESSHRIQKALEELEFVGAGSRMACVCRELTKKFETTYRGTVADLVKKNIPDKGEFVVVVAQT